MNGRPLSVRTRPARRAWLLLAPLLALSAALTPLPGRLTGPAQAAPAGAAAHHPSPPWFASGSVLVAFRPGVGAAVQHRLLSAAGASLRRHLGVGAELVAVAPGAEQRVVDQLRASSAVRYAEPDYYSRPTGTPNDPSFGQQWALRNTGQTVNGITGTPGADADVVPAWNLTTGSRSIVVAEVDTGVDYTHPDLAANIWTNNGSVNGCAAGTHGYNVLTGTCDPMDDDTTYGGHGTHVAGIIGAVGNNGTGVSGVNWSTTILPVKWIPASSAGATSDLIRALDWVLRAKAAGVNIRVVNDSNVFVGTAYSQALLDEIDALAQHNILFVDAAGSSGGNNDDPAQRRYPCAYGRTNEVCATWTGQSNTLPAGANVGRTTVDLAAPGDNIYSTLRGGGYGYVSGGSMAAAAVSGAAALVLARTPSMTARNLKADLLEHAKPLSALAGRTRTGGLLDICAAVAGCKYTAALRRPFAVTAPYVNVVTAGHPAPEPQTGVRITGTRGDWDAVPSGTTYAYQWARCSSTGGSCTAISGATGAGYTPTSTDLGHTLQLTVRATSPSGSTASSSAPTMVVQTGSSALVFGKTAVGGTDDPATADFERLDRFTAPYTGYVSKLTVYLTRLTAGSQVLRGAVYADANGRPGALLGATGDVTVPTSATSGWVTLPFSSPVAVRAGKSWFGAQFGGTSQVFALRYDDGVAGSGAVVAQPFGSGPAPASAAWTTGYEQASLYATYIVSSSTLTLHSTPNPSVAGRWVRLYGQLTSGPASAKRITLYSYVPGHAVTAGTLTTSSSGSWYAWVRPSWTTYYKVAYAGDPVHRAVSTTWMKQGVATRLAITSPANGLRTSVRTLTVRGTTSPNKAGSYVTVDGIVNGRAYYLGRALVMSNGTFALVHRFGRGTWVLRAYIGATTNNLAGVSPGVTLYEV